MYMYKRISFLLSALTVVIMSSCNIDDVITTSLPPEIVIQEETSVYTTKLGREIIIKPEYKNALEATYSWTLDGEVISTSPSLMFVSDSLGEYYVTITVSTQAGVDSEEIRIDVVELEIPTVSISAAKQQTIAVRSSTELSATIRNTSLETTFEWHINNEYASSEPTLTFLAQECGSYCITATASNEDGTHSDTVMVTVLTPEDMPFEWKFAKYEYHTVVGRKLRIQPFMANKLEGVSFAWSIDGSKVVTDTLPSFVYQPTSEGKHTITAVASYKKDGNAITLEHTFLIDVFVEGEFYRASSASSVADWNKVYEYTPAPGQFINELKTGGFNGTQTTPEAAIAYAEARMLETNKKGEPSPNYVSLGGFGGYIVVGFDHSIDNSGDYDLAILGNSFSGSSEPGIVWVMQDENGDGLPNDTWYELAGSETGKEETIQEYAVTYYRPSGPYMPVQWTDNLGDKGEIDYLMAYHRQEYYYPLWIEQDSYTLTGTCLKARNYDKSGNGTYWVNAEYDWGYADNFSPIDRLTGDANAAADANANHFKISNAIDFDCQPIDLKFIDFVKVQVGVNTKSGWLGEVSTEVFGFYDYNMKKNDTSNE